jgi:hypothetical protein
LEFEAVEALTSQHAELRDSVSAALPRAAAELTKKLTTLDAQQQQVRLGLWTATRRLCVTQKLLASPRSS